MRDLFFGEMALVIVYNLHAHKSMIRLHQIREPPHVQNHQHGPGSAMLFCHPQRRQPVQRIHEMISAPSFQGKKDNTFLSNYLVKLGKWYFHKYDPLGFIKFRNFIIFISKHYFELFEPKYDFLSIALLKSEIG